MSQSTIWAQSLTDFATATASSSPVPGGGSVVMVSATLGISLVAMALQISKAKAEDQAPYDALLATIADLSTAMQRAADQDIAAFSSYMAALQMPRDSEADKLARKARLLEVAIESTRTPLAGARLCLEGLKAAELAHGLSTKHLVSDVKAGAHLLVASLSAVLLNVDANLGSLDPANRDRFGTERTQLEAEGRAQFLKVIPG